MVQTAHAEATQAVDSYLRAIEPSKRGDVAEIEALESSFVRVVKSFSEEHCISYEAWVDVGVHPGVLRRSGIHPSLSEHRTF